MLKKTKASVLAFGMLLTASAFAHHHDDMKISANFDMNYTHWSNGGSGNSGEAIPNHMHNTNANELNIQLAEIALSGSHKSLDYWVSFDAAQLSADGEFSNFITEAYLTQNINDQFSVTAGRFYGNLGFESIRAKDNWNYSRSLGFQYNPFWHQGVAANYDSGQGFAASVFAYNEINGVDSDTEHKSYSVQLSYARDNFAATYNYYTRGAGESFQAQGNDGLEIHDLSVRYDFNEQFSAAINYIMTEAAVNGGDDAEWSSLAAYVHYQANERWDFNLRYEMFEAENLAATGAGTFADNVFSRNAASTQTTAFTKNKINSITLTAGYDLMNNSKLMLEYRMDKSDEEIWGDEDGNADDSQNTIALAWVFSI